mmetsp:Transcript_41268/g.103690  ORF Transcript_41268/g.103690 Transcript_41268/m.103690 type:complete len:530 (+) Transcript_41268:139-1728(+)
MSAQPAVGRVAALACLAALLLASNCRPADCTGDELGGGGLSRRTAEVVPPGLRHPLRHPHLGHVLGNSEARRAHSASHYGAAHPSLSEQPGTTSARSHHLGLHLSRQRAWIHERPAGTALGPQRLRCMDQPPVAFYLMEEAMVKCDVPLGPDFLRNLGGGVKHSAEIFFYHQLKSHPWRVADPDDATLVVVPLFLGLLARGVCPGYHSEGKKLKALHEIGNIIKHSPRYKQTGGADFMMLTTDWMGSKMFNQADNFRRVTRHFIYAYKQTGDNGHMPNSHDKGEMCIVPVPTTITYLMRHCHGSTQKGVHCPDRQLEGSFQEYLAKRDINLFFMGKTRQRRYAPRRMFIKEAAPLSSPDGKPNYLIAFQPLEKWPPGPECTGAPETWNGCVVDDRTGANYNLYEATLQRSRLAVMIAGLDPSSTRFFDHIYEGAPQLMLSDHYFQTVFPFRCKVSQAQMVYTLSQKKFMSHPRREVARALRAIYGKNATLLEELWTTQMASRKELLWQIPGSRVAENVLQDAVRRCFSS